MGAALTLQLGKVGDVVRPVLRLPLTRDLAVAVGADVVRELDGAAARAVRDV